MSDNTKPFQGFDWGTSQIKMNRPVTVMRPIEIHHKADGSVKDEPSFAIVMTNENINASVCGEISLEMFNEGLKDIGYEIVKRK